MTSSPPRRLTRILLGAALVAAMPAGLQAGSAAHAAQAPAFRPADDGAAIVGQKWISKSLVDIDVRTPALGRTLKVRVQVPKGWSRTAKRTWPVVYAFAGGGGDTQATWMEQTDIEKVAAGWRTLLVMPYPGVSGGHANWFNYGKRGNPRWETFHTLELRQLIERNFRGGAKRAAIGISSGGHGAIIYAAHKPGMFKFAASYSGILHITAPGVPPALMVINSPVKGDAPDPFRIWGVPYVNAANWRYNDPYHQAAKLKGTALYISSGTTGERGPLDPKDLTLIEAIGARIVGGVSEQMAGRTSGDLVKRLRQLKIPVTAHLYGNGWHQWKYWDREMKRSWPLMMKAVGAEKAT